MECVNDVRESSPIFCMCVCVCFECVVVAQLNVWFIREIKTIKTKRNIPYKGWKQVEVSRYEIPTQGISVSALNSFAILVVQTLTMVWSSEDKNTPSIRPTNTTISCLKGRVTTPWLVTWGGPGSRLPWLEDLEDLVEAEDRLVVSSSSFWLESTCSIYSVLSGKEVKEVLAMAADEDEFISLE